MFAQSGTVRGTLRLFIHVLAFSAVFWIFHTALPAYLLVPDRVRTWICALPRPSSASAGARITRISATMSGFKNVADWKPALTPYRPPALLLTPSRWTLTF